MKDVKTYKLADRYDDQHITDVTFGHHRVKYNGQIKEIIAVVIRGTQTDSVEEWSSNFDIGCDSIYEGNGLIPRNKDWEIKENHMGFDIAATRVIKLLDEYLSQAEKLDHSAKKTLWITGHSRGAAISNIVGSQLDSKYETFVYTFATPRTTTVSEKIAKSHESIFNIINNDDIITAMPLEEKWDFIHYGNDIPNGVGDSHFEEWKSFTTLTYDFNQKKRMIFWTLSKHWLLIGMIAMCFIVLATEMVGMAKV